MKFARILVLVLLPLITTTLAGCSVATHAAASKAEATRAAPAPDAAHPPIPAQSAPAPEELWIIAKDQPVQQPAAANEEILPNSGALLARLPDQGTLVPIPLKHTDVKAEIA